MNLQSERFRRKMFIFGVLIPVFLLHVVINLLNRALSMILSLFEWNGYMPVGKFVGLDNIKRMIHDPYVWNALWNNIYFAFWSLIFTVFIALVLAYIVTRSDLRERKWYEVVFFLPNTLSMVIISMLWLFIFNPSFGLLTSLVNSLGLTAPVWLGDIHWVKPSLVLVQVWASLGFYFLIYVAAIKNIPNTLYEAAEIDGASNYQKFIKITLPLIWNIVATTMIFNFISSFNGGFTLIKIMTNGGPNRESEILATYLYSVGIDNLDYGYGSAIGLIAVILSLAFYLIITKLFQTQTYEY